MIFASTNADRIGTFHAIGHKAAQTEQTIEVFQMMIFPEHKKGSICHSIITAVFLQ